MKELTLQAYASMLDALEQCDQSGMSCLERLECQFHVANQCWQEVRRKLAGYRFVSVQEEIEFFRTVKPLFTSKITYYNLVYHSYLFHPPAGSAAWAPFWQREALRLERFRDEHPFFYRYYKEGNSDRDERYFRSGDRGTPSLLESSHDALVATLLALEEYKRFAEGQLQASKG